MQNTSLACVLLVIGVMDAIWMRITRDSYLSQYEYVCKTIKKFNMESAKPLSTPLSMNVKIEQKLMPQI